LMPPSSSRIDCDALDVEDCAPMSGVNVNIVTGLCHSQRDELLRPQVRSVRSVRARCRKSASNPVTDPSCCLGKISDHSVILTGGGDLQGRCDHTIREKMKQLDEVGSQRDQVTQSCDFHQPVRSIRSSSGNKNMNSEIKIETKKKKIHKKSKSSSLSGGSFPGLLCYPVRPSEPYLRGLSWLSSLSWSSILR
jgi:hypothetical protein